MSWSTAKFATGPFDNLGEKGISIKLPHGYMVDQEESYYRRSKEIPKENYHIIYGKKNVITAKFDLNTLNPSDDVKPNQKSNWVPVACKRYPYEQLSKEEGFSRVLREVQICRTQTHQNIVRFYEIFLEKKSEEINDAIWLVSERMEHTLETYFEHLSGDLDIRHMGALLIQVLRAVDYLHQRGIMHRRIAPAYIGINPKGFEIKLLDFGIARDVSPIRDHSVRLDCLPCYQAIEMLMRVEYCSKVDIWATAVVAIEMLGLKLFMPSGDQVRKRGLEGAMKDRIFHVIGVPDHRYSSLFGRPVAYNICPSKLDEVLTPHMDKFMNVNDIDTLTKENFFELMKEMLEPNARIRPGADECLRHPFLKTLNEKLTKSKESSRIKDEENQNMQAKKRLELELTKGHNQLYYGPIAAEEANE